MSLKKVAPSPRPFIGEFGLRAKGGINKPSYYSFGFITSAWQPTNSKRIKEHNCDEDHRWRYRCSRMEPGRSRPTGTTRTMELAFRDVPPNAKVSLQRVDSDHGNVLKQYAAMDKPVDPTPAQVEHSIAKRPYPHQANLR